MRALPRAAFWPVAAILRDVLRSPTRLGKRGAVMSADAAEPDDVAVVYARLMHVIRSQEVAEALTIEVCCRLRDGGPQWLHGRERQVRRDFFCVQAILRHRKIL